MGDNEVTRILTTWYEEFGHLWDDEVVHAMQHVLGITPPEPEMPAVEVGTWWRLDFDDGKDCWLVKAVTADAVYLGRSGRINFVDEAQLELSNFLETSTPIGEPEMPKCPLCNGSRLINDQYSCLCKEGYDRDFIDKAIEAAKGGA